MSYNIRSELYNMYDSRYGTYINAVKYRVGGEINAEDVVQEAFTRAMQYEDSFNPSYKPLEAWFRTILNNAAKDFKRAEKMQGMGFVDDYISDTLDALMIRSELCERIIEDMIVSDSSEILRMYFLLGYPPRDIAKVVDIEPQSISNTIQRFKHRMREKYDE